MRERRRSRVRSSGSGWAGAGLGVVLYGRDDSDFAFHVLLDDHDCSPIVGSVVGGGEDGDESFVGEKLEPVLNHLVGSDDEVDVQRSASLLDCVRSEVAADTAKRTSPTFQGVVGIRPEQIASNAISREVGVVQGAL